MKLKMSMSGDSISESVINPLHYKSHQSGIECIQITEHMNFNLGNAVKYIWRHEGKNGVEDLRKAAWYIDREIQRLGFNSEMTKIKDRIIANLDACATATFPPTKVKRKHK